ncbi:MAG: helix-hairpin-helix domain-containing protein [Prevotellaceae bacterium]|jgi:competence ComEA-like helix-hairpin-helix protein|nr:helix-hairpin-helix domain-containing protein [Prevotellaceae bacterium]
MSRFKSFFRDLFAFSSSDRLGTTALIVILFAVIVTPQFFPENNEFMADETEHLKKELDVFLAEMKKMDKQQNDSLFVFDPNTIDSASLVLLGFSPAQARSIIKYRKSGGKFYNREGFGRSYAVSEAMFERLYQYIDIKNEDRRKFAESGGKFKPKEKETEQKKFETKPAGTVEKQFPEKTLLMVELNTADTAMLQKLKGIGSYYAQRIVEYRNKLGGFYAPEQLMEIKGVDTARFELFSKQITVDISQIKRIKINEIAEADLAKHPYIRNYLAKSIAKYRKFKIKITSSDELLTEKILTEEQLKKIIPYIEF